MLGTSTTILIYSFQNAFTTREALAAKAQGEITESTPLLWGFLWTSLDINLLTTRVTLDAGKKDILQITVRVPADQTVAVYKSLQYIGNYTYFHMGCFSIEE